MSARRGAHRRARTPTHRLALRGAVALTALLFLVGQPTGAASRAGSYLLSGADDLAPATATTSVPAPEATIPAAPAAVTTRLVGEPAPTSVATTRPAPRFAGNAEPVALTFDDGPHETYTPQVLDILARYDVRATFFVVGAQVERWPDLTRRIVALGHSLGNHTWDHVDLTTLDDEGFRGRSTGPTNCWRSLPDTASAVCGRLTAGSTNSPATSFGRADWQ